MNTILKLKKINLKYQTDIDSINVLKNIDLNIKKKETVSVVGESGSGKTSLIMLIGGLEKPNSGKIIFQDQEITGLSEDEVSKLQTELENELRENINANSEFIKNISKEILETKTALKNIEKLIKENSNKESKVDLTSITKSIELLNKNFNSLSYEISSIKNKSIEY